MLSSVTSVSKHCGMSQCTGRVREEVVHGTCFPAMRKRVLFARRQVKGSIRSWLSPQCQELSCVARPARVREVGRMIGLAIPHRFLDVISARQRSPCRITLVSIITIELEISPPSGATSVAWWALRFFSVFSALTEVTDISSFSCFIMRMVSSLKVCCAGSHRPTR